ncbi:MAG: hypothetical protein NVV62_14050 [Terricaulis sp.]|nr:hypothetical protein [Terricaulis sp.]
MSAAMPNMSGACRLMARHAFFSQREGLRAAGVKACDGESRMGLIADRISWFA